MSDGLRIPEDLPLVKVVLDPFLITMGNKESGASLEAITRALPFIKADPRNSQPTKAIVLVM